MTLFSQFIQCTMSLHILLLLLNEAFSRPAFGGQNLLRIFHSCVNSNPQNDLDENRNRVCVQLARDRLHARGEGMVTTGARETTTAILQAILLLLRKMPRPPDV